MDLSRRDSLPADPAVELYRRYREAEAERQRLQRIADGFLKTHRKHSQEHHQAEDLADEAWENKMLIYRELVATPARSAAALMLLTTVLHENQLLSEGDPDDAGFRTMIAGIRALFSAGDLAAAEQLLAKEGVAH